MGNSLTNEIDEKIYEIRENFVQAFQKMKVFDDDAWNWQFDSLLLSWSRIRLDQWICLLNEDTEIYCDIAKQAFSSTAARIQSITTNLDLENKSLRWMAQIVARNKTLDHVFNLREMDIFLFQFVSKLQNRFGDVSSAFDPHLLHKALFFVFTQEVISGLCYSQCVRRYDALPENCREMLNIILDLNKSNHNLHYKNTMITLQEITRKKRLPADYGDEKESVLNGVLGEELARFKRMDELSKLDWIEKKGEYAIRNVLQRLQGLIDKQDIRTPDLQANKEYLDAEPNKLAVDPEPIHDSEFSDQQIAQLKSAFGKTGANVATAINEDPDASNAELVESVSKMIGHEISLSTIEKYKKRFRDNSKIFRDIVKG